MKYILALAVILVLSLFAFSVNLMNPGAITLNYYFGIEWSLKLATLLLSVFLVGLFVGASLIGLSLLGQKMKTGKANRKLKKVEKEVEGLRAAEPVDV